MLAGYVLTADGLIRWLFCSVGGASVQHRRLLSSSADVIEPSNTLYVQKQREREENINC